MGFLDKLKTPPKTVKTTKPTGLTADDLKAAMRMGAKPILVRTGYGAETEKELTKFTYRDIKRQVKIYDNLEYFVKELCG